MTRTARNAALAVFSLALLNLLVIYSGLRWAEILSSFARPSWLILLSVVALTAAIFSLGTLKWLIVMRAFVPNCKPISFLNGMLTTTLGAALGQIMPVQLGIAVARSLAGRLGVGASPGVNLGTTAFEQSFDVVVFLAAAVTSLVGLKLRPGLSELMLLVILSGLSVVVLWSLLSRLMVASAGFLSRNRINLGPYLRNLDFGTAKECIIELPRSRVLQLIALSALRYVIILLRAFVLLSALGMAKFGTFLMIGFPLIQFVTLLPITPGNLGITEWTWSAVLVSAGSTIRAATLFAITIRVLSVAAQLILLLTLLTARLCQRTSIWRRATAA